MGLEYPGAREMNSRIIAGAALVLAIGCSGTSRGVEISNFRSGLACRESVPGHSPDGWICHVTEDVLVTDQGRCVYDNQAIPCTWVGFEFDYRDAKAGDALDCIEETDRPSSVGNPKEEIKPDATSNRYSIPLDAGAGHFFNPQYYGYKPRPPGQALMVSKTTCTIHGKPAFAYTYRIRMPERAMP